VALGGESGGKTAALLYSVALSCKHLVRRVTAQLIPV
jgi:hypothetical protein